MTYIMSDKKPIVFLQCHLRKMKNGLLIARCVMFYTRSSADADNGLDVFSGQSRSTNMVPFWVHCDFSLSM